MDKVNCTNPLTINEISCKTIKHAREDFRKKKAPKRTIKLVASVLDIAVNQVTEEVYLQYIKDTCDGSEKISRDKDKFTKQAIYDVAFGTTPAQAIKNQFDEIRDTQIPGRCWWHHINANKRKGGKNG